MKLSMSNIRKAASVLVLGLAVSLLALGSSSIASISSKATGAFPAESCLYKQSRQSPHYLLCFNVNMHLEQISSRRGLPDDPNPHEVMEKLIKILIEDGDHYMAAYLLARGTDQERPQKALGLLDGETLVGANWIRALAHAELGGSELRQDNLGKAKEFIDQAQREIAGAEGEYGLLINGVVMEISARFDIMSGDFYAAILHGKAAADSFVEIGSPLAPSLILSGLATLSRGIDRDIALTFRSLSETYACDHGTPEFCEYVKGNSELFRARGGAEKEIEE